MRTTTKATIVALVGAAVMSATASAVGPLNLVKTWPDVASGFINVSYNAGTGLFTAEGFTQNYELTNGSGQVPAGQRRFFISAFVDNLGNLAGPGSLEVRADYGGTDQLVFFSNSILAFGSGPSNKFEFIFDSEGGSFGGIGNDVGTILVDQNLAFPGGVPVFTNSFSDTFFGGNADTFVIPAPSAVSVGALAGLLAARRRR